MPADFYRISSNCLSIWPRRTDRPEFGRSVLRSAGKKIRFREKTGSGFRAREEKKQTVYRSRTGPAWPPWIPARTGRESSLLTPQSALLRGLGLCRDPHRAGRTTAAVFPLRGAVKELPPLLFGPISPIREKHRKFYLSCENSTKTRRKCIHDGNFVPCNCARNVLNLKRKFLPASFALKNKRGRKHGQH